MSRRFWGSVLALLACLVLVGCESAEERAERHYQSAKGYLGEGEVELALVDLRRVFQLDQVHRDARALYASTVRDLGQVEEAYGQYLRLVEQYPDDLEGRVALAQMAFDLGDWPEMERHGGRAVALAPDAHEVTPISIALDYRAASVADDPAGMAVASRRARDWLQRDPDDPIARGVLVHHLLGSDNPASALGELDGVLALRPDDLQLHIARLSLVTQMQDEGEIEAQLLSMSSRFPDDPTVQRARLGWHLSHGETDAAEALLRKVAAQTPGEPDGYVSLVRFIERNRGADAALAELEDLTALAGTEERNLYESMAAAIVFDTGEKNAAIERLRTLVAGSVPADQTRDIELMLARMLQAVGDREGASALVAEVLAEDAGHVEALKMRSATAIQEDRASDAILDLRRALDQAPDDPEIPTLMATAHEREGSMELAGERLALAVDVSGAAVSESVRYSRFLLDRDRLSPARQVLVRALREAPGDLDLSALMAETLVRQEDWGSVEHLRAELAARSEPEARAIAETLTTALMLSGDRVEETAAVLEQEMRDGSFEGGRRDFAVLAMLRASQGDLDGAHKVLTDALGQYPGDPQFRMLEVALDLRTGDATGAEAKLRGLLADSPGAEAPLNELLKLLREEGRDNDAATLVEEQLQAMPGSQHLRVIHGGLLAELGRIDEAIAVLEEVYAEDTSHLIAANNLASVLATHRGDDPATLERAATIARRLRDRDAPAFQDTYGWIEFLRGNVPEALAHLEPAAAGLPSDALVQYHLGRAYEAGGRHGEAGVQYQRALDLADGTEIENLPQFADASERFAALHKAVEPTPGE